jgi:hypothetical protein
LEGILNKKILIVFRDIGEMVVKRLEEDFKIMKENTKDGKIHLIEITLVLIYMFSF